MLAIELIDKNFGFGYSKTYFKNNELKSGYSVFKCEEVDGVIVYSSLEKNRRLFEELSTFLSLRTLVLNLIVIDVEQRGEKKGKYLLNKFREEHEHKAFLIPVWKYEGSEGLRKYIMRNGGYAIKEIADFWREDSLQKNYRCLVCGAPPCKCSMELFFLPPLK